MSRRKRLFEAGRNDEHDLDLVHDALRPEMLEGRQDFFVAVGNDQEGA